MVCCKPFIFCAVLFEQIQNNGYVTCIYMNTDDNTLFDINHGGIF